MPLLAALILTPLIEIGLFIELGGALGLWPTLGLVLFTAVIGAALMRAQGFAAMSNLQTAMERGEDPRGPLAEGATVLFAGALMLTPGFFTDAVGLLLLLPPTRRTLLAWIGPRLAVRAAAARARSGGERPTAGPGAGDDPISVDYEVVDAPDRTDQSVWTRPPQS